MNNSDAIEFIKIGVIMIAGYIIIKALLSIDDQDSIANIYYCCKEGFICLN